MQVILFSPGNTANRKKPGAILLGMYRYFVLFLLGSGLLIGGYYVRQAGIEKVFSLSPHDAEMEPLSMDDVIGKYICSGTTGCRQDYEITLYPSGGAKLSEVKDGEEPIVVERGSWQFVSGGLISLSLDQKNVEGKDDITYTKPVTLLIQSNLSIIRSSTHLSVSQSLLSRISSYALIINAIQIPIAPPIAERKTPERSNIDAPQRLGIDPPTIDPITIPPIIIFLRSIDLLL
jgi:hypothetical protein